MSKMMNIERIMFTINSSCNVDCRMCCYSPHEQWKNGSHFVSYADFTKMWGPALHAISSAWVQLHSGGDCMAHPDYGRIASYILPHIKTLHIYTNGTKLLTLPSDLDFSKINITVSLEGSTAATHEAYCRGADYEEIWAGLHWAKDMGAKLFCNTCLMDGNKHELVSLARMLADEDFASFRLFATKRSWRGEELAPSDEDSLATVKAVREECEESGLFFADSVSPFLGVGVQCISSNVFVHPDGSISCPWAFGGLMFGHTGYVRCCPNVSRDKPYAHMPTDLLTAYQSEGLETIRQELLAGKPSELCRRCVQMNQRAEGEAPTGNWLATSDLPHPFESYSLPAVAPYQKPNPAACLKPCKERSLIESVPKRLQFYRSQGLVDTRSKTMIEVGSGYAPTYCLSFLPAMKKVTAYDPRPDQWDIEKIKVISLRLLNTVDQVMYGAPEVNQSVWARLGDLTITNEKPTDTYDFVFCCSVLEHVAEWEPFIEDCLEFLAPGGMMWLSWAPWFSWQGAHVGLRDTHWNHLLLDEDSFYRWIKQRYDSKIADNWLEDRHSDHGFVNRVLVSDIEGKIARSEGIEIVTHTTPQWREDDLEKHPQRDTLLEIAERKELCCKSDNWLLRRTS